MTDKWTAQDVMEHARELKSPFDKSKTPLSQMIQKLRDQLRKGAKA